MAVEPPAPKFQLPPGGIHAVVWDWDKTVLKIHSWGSRVQAINVSAGHHDGDFADGECFKVLVMQLLQAGVKVYIASFGSFEVIYAYTVRMFGTDNPFDRKTISTPGALSPTKDSNGHPLQYKDGVTVAGQKLPQLMHICKAEGLKREQVMFFDGTYLFTSKGTMVCV
jgi:hypothetical protein